jgi:uncharacterized membrane protein
MRQSTDETNEIPFVGAADGNAPLKEDDWALEKGFPLFHKIFQLGLILKGINAIVELGSSLLLFLFPLQKLRGIVAGISRLAGGPWLRREWPIIFYRLERWIAPDTKTFFSWFFLSHGAVKAFIVVCLFCGWRWAYPLGISVFSAFIAYQVFEIAKGQHSLLYLVLTILDIFVIYLTTNEWRHANRVRKAAR